MKKLLCVSVLITGLILCNQNKVNAQTSSVGLMAGLSAANVNGTDFDTQVRTGFMAGVFYRFLISGGALFLQPELAYVQRGFKEDFEGDEVTAKLDYITLNLLLNYHFASTGSFTPFLGFGPYLAFIASAKQEFDGDEVDIDDSVKNTDFGIQARVGIELTRLMIAAYITQGLSSVFEDSDEDVRNFTFGFLVGFYLY